VIVQEFQNKTKYFNTIIIEFILQAFSAI